jgi:hypothetical protein
MPLDLDIRSFFRKAPRELLRHYFVRQAVKLEFDWASLTVRDINPLHQAWLLLSQELRQRMTDDFRNIALLATPAGKLAIIDEAEFRHGSAGVAAQLAELEDFYACAFWTFFERPDLWDGAISFAVADGKPRRSWRKRVNMPVLGRKPTEGDGKALGEAIGKLLMEREARGLYCDVHQYRRGDREYYFAYPQDHHQTSVEYDAKGEWTKRPHNPAFEIILVHNDKERSLDVWHQGSGERVKDLQVLFARTVLGVDIPLTSPKDVRVYELSDLARRGFQFRRPDALGIWHASIRKIRVQVLGARKYTVRIELSADCPEHVLYDRLEAAMVDIPPSMQRVSQVGIKVTFELRPGDKRNRTRTFEITWPNSCSLQSSGHDVVIQRMLQENGIEPRMPLSETENAGESQ